MSEAEESGDRLEWAKRLVDRKSWVIHLQTMTVGRVERLYDGTGSLYISPVNQQAVRTPVLELEGGASHVAEASSFLELSDSEREYVMMSIHHVDRVLVESAAIADGMRMGRPKAMLLLATVLRMRASVLDRARDQIVRAMEQAAAVREAECDAASSDG